MLGREGGRPQADSLFPAKTDEALGAEGRGAAVGARDALVLFGALIDEALEDQVWVTVVATGYDGAPTVRRAAQPAGARRLVEPMGEPRGAGRSPPPPPRHGYEDREDMRRRAATASVQSREREAPARRSGGLRV